jgi:hypothetical protein
VAEPTRLPAAKVIRPPNLGVDSGNHANLSAERCVVSGRIVLARFSMKTYPIYRPDGSLHGFEITSSWLTFRPLFTLLRSVAGVRDVRRNWFNDDRITFTFQGKAAVVHEPWGDSSRYWVGLQDPDAAPEVDLEPLHQAFKRYRGFLVVTLWP